MSKNMSNLDRRLRAYLLTPAAVLAGILVGPGTVGAIVLYAVAAILLATAAVGHCPLYSLLRFDGRGQHPSTP